MLPLVCNDAVALFFMFDLSRKVTLNSVKEWFLFFANERERKSFDETKKANEYRF